MLRPIVHGDLQFQVCSSSVQMYQALHPDPAMQCFGDWSSPARAQRNITISAWKYGHMLNQTPNSIVLCPDVYAQRQRTSGGFSYIFCHRGVSSVEALIALRLSEDKCSFLYYMYSSCSPTFKQSATSPIAVTIVFRSWRWLKGS